VVLIQWSIELEQIGALFRLLAQLYQQVSEKLRIVESLWKELSEYIEQWLKDVTEMTNFIEENRTASPLMQDIAIRIDAVKHSYSRLSKHATEYLLELQKLGLLSCQTKDILE
jgi:Na+/phosphate symporter